MPGTEQSERVAHERPEGSDSDGDEAPEVVSTQNAKEQALELLRQESEARSQAKAAAKRKRKTKASAQEAPQTEVEELSADVLSAVAARNDEEEQEQEEEAAMNARAKKRRAATEAKRAAALAKKTHTRQFGNIHVQTLEALEASENRQLSESAQAFLARREAPHRERMNVLEGHPTLFTKKQKQKQRSQRV